MIPFHAVAEAECDPQFRVRKPQAPQVPPIPRVPLFGTVQLSEPIAGHRPVSQPLETHFTVVKRGDIWLLTWLNFLVAM